METTVNMTVAQTVIHHTTVAEQQGSVWEDANLDGKKPTVITVRMINDLSEFDTCILIF